MLDPQLQREITLKNRRFMQATRADDPYEEDFESDQQLRRPQPPLVKSPMADESARIALPLEFDALPLDVNLADIFRQRRSARVYTQEGMTLLQLSFLLWSTQGVKAIRGKSYATLRTAPSGGARHPFETYLLVRDVESLAPGLYHYLPMDHAIEYLGAIENWNETVSDALVGQKWACKANVVFLWSMVAYRAEWRYGIYAHRVALMDVGHMGENLYLACAPLGLGTCVLGAFDHDVCCKLLTLDGEEEFPVYAAPVGTVSAADADKEKAFYKFVEDEGL